MEWSQLPLPASSWRPWLMLAAAVPLLALLVQRRGRGDTHKRGARVLSGRAARRARRRRRGALQLAGVSLSAAEETRHFKLIGTTGTGKSAAITALLARALERGDRAVITDPDGGYRARFYQPGRGDVLLN